MIIRKYRSSDCEEMAELFYETVHAVNKKDYSKEQLEAWADGKVDLEKWDRSFRRHDTVVAVEGRRIIGFGDMDRSGYLDRLFVHKNYQRKGAASAICDQLERRAAGKVFVYASITARGFFEKRGYRVVEEQQVVRKGVVFRNFVMEKPR